MSALPGSGRNLAELRLALADDIERLAEELLGAPNKGLSRRGQLRFGSKGSLSLELRGHKRGTWYDHEAGQGGGPIGLVRHVRSCGYDAAVEWAWQWVGGAISFAPPPARPKPQADIEPDETEAARIATARRMWIQSRAIAGTLAERYLVETRAIPAPADGWPIKAARYHARTRSLILAATLSDGTVQGVQRVRLDEHGRKAADGKPAKISNGVFPCAAVRLPGDPAGPLYLAEGPETGLTVWRATGCEVWIALGGVAKIEPPHSRHIVILADDDPRMPKAGKPANAHRSRQDAIKRWRTAGHKVTVVYPWAIRRGDKSDFNDLAKAEGIAAVRARIESQLRPGLSPVARVPVEQARVILAERVQNWTAAALDHWGTVPENRATPPVHAIKIDVGAGKSEAARHGLVELLGKLRADGDDRSLAIAVPTHKLGDEQLTRILGLPNAKALGLTGAVWRGYGADDPAAPGSTMCRNLNAVRDALSAMQDVQSSVCGDPEKGAACPFYEACSYQRQRRKQADIWVVAHDLLFHERPKNLRELAALVVDEAPWQAGLKGCSAHDQITLAVDALDADDEVPGDALASRRLRFLRQSALDVLRAAPDGPISREAFRATNVTAENAREARGLEWRRHRTDVLRPGMTRAQRAEAIETASINRSLSRLSMFWTAIEALLADGGPEASGWVSLGREDTEAGPVRALQLKDRADVRDGWQVPTLHLDATLRIDLLRPYWPGVELVADIEVLTPHMRVVQVTDKSFSKAALLHGESAGYAIKKLREQLHHLARQAAPGRVLAVLQKDVEEAVKALGPLPRNLAMAHHNAIAGRDEWRDVRLLVVVGRTQPPPHAVATMAEALTGSAVSPLEGWYERTDAIRETTAGEAELAEFDRHPDPLAEAIRWCVCEAELVQIIGRGRGVNRTAAAPLDVLVMTDVPLRIPLDRTISANDLHLTQAERMLALGGVAFENGADAFRAYPDLWPSAEAARQALKPSRSGTKPNERVLIRECPTPPALWIYQRATAGAKRAEVLIDLAMVPDPAAWLAERLGKLARCEPAPVTQPVITQEEEGPMVPERGAMLDPAKLYRRAVLEPPPADMLTCDDAAGLLSRLRCRGSARAWWPVWKCQRGRGCPGSCTARCSMISAEL
jgi:putative DNA primase/helicase